MSNTPVERASLLQYQILASVRSGSNSDVGTRDCQVRFTPGNRHRQLDLPCPKSAMKRLVHRSKRYRYSITSSASASIAGGISIPNTFAVLRLIQKSNLVGRSIGISPTLSPFKILSMK
jgi:hypothetical protein